MAQVTALYPVMAEFVVDTEVEVNEASVACCSLPTTRSSACVMVGPMPEWSELSMVFVEIASKIQSIHFHPSTTPPRTDVNNLPGSPNDDLQAMSSRPRDITLPGAWVMGISGSTFGARM